MKTGGENGKSGKNCLKGKSEFPTPAHGSMAGNLQLSFIKHEAAKAMERCPWNNHTRANFRNQFSFFLFLLSYSCQLSQRHMPP